MERHPQPLHEEKDEEQDDHYSPHEAQLLADDAEDEVVGAFGEPELLFDAVAEAEARHAAGADGVKALQGLVGHLGKVMRPAVEAALQVGDGVDMPQQRLQQACAKAGTRPCDDAAAAAQHEDGAHDGRRQDDARHMRLQHQQAHHRDEGQQRDDQLPHDALVEPFPHRDPAGRGGVELFQMGRFRGQMGREQDHLELGDL